VKTPVIPFCRSDPERIGGLFCSSTALRSFEPLRSR